MGILSFFGPKGQISEDRFDWNDKDWKEEFVRITDKLKDHPDDGAQLRLRNMRKEVYRHTMTCVNAGYYFNAAGRKVRFGSAKKLARKSVFCSKQLPAPSSQRFDHTVVEVINDDCLSVAKQLIDAGERPAVLNMASRNTPGGGVVNGAGAQEENLFRRSNLFKSMYQYSTLSQYVGIKTARDQYPMDENYGGIYSPDVTVFRGVEKEGYPLLDEPYQVSVISVAGISYPALTDQGLLEPHLVESTKNKIRTILNIGYIQRHDVLVLGALGCGAFGNPPEQIAALFHQVIEQEYLGQFKKICFAILEDHNSGRGHNPEGNYLPFWKEFCKQD